MVGVCRAHKDRGFFLLLFFMKILLNCNHFIRNLFFLWII